MKSKQNGSKLDFLLNVILVCITLLILLCNYPLDDPDFGWHFRTGERIVEGGSLPTFAWFTYFIPQYPWVCHEWLQDSFIYLLHSVGGMWGIKIWYALLGAVLIFCVIGKLYEEGVTPLSKNLIAVLLASFIFKGFFLRPQLITILGFTLVLLLVDRIKSTGDWRYSLLLPVLFLCWANLHAGFFIGFVLLGMIWVFEFCKNRIQSRPKDTSFLQDFIDPQRTFSPAALKQVFLWSFVSVPITLINPHGYHLYEEILRTVRDPYKMVLTEWMPTDLASYEGTALYAAVLLIMFVFAVRRKKPDLTDFSLVLLFFIMGLSARRNVVFFVIIVACQMIKLLKADFSRRHHAPARWLAGLFSVVIFLPLLFVYLQKPMDDSLAGRFRIAHYPDAAVEFLNTREESMRIYHNYDWGGFMLWKNPNAKTYLDGRMAHWQVDGRKLFWEWFETYTLKPGWQERLEQDNIEAVFVSKDSILARGLVLLPDIWEETYRDEIAVIFERKESLLE